MGLFGSADDKQRDNDALAAEVVRLDGLPFEALAAEVFTRGFAAGAPGAEGHAAIYQLVEALSPIDRVFGVDATLTEQLADLVQEGLHLLYRAGLVQWEFSGGDHASMDWGPTRAGRRALEQGTVAVALAGCGPKVP